MSHRLKSIRHAVKALILTQFLVAGRGGAAPTAIPSSVNAVDEGAVDPNSSMSAMILVNNPKVAAYDAAVASLYDVSSSNYHRWMSESEISAWGPASQDIALLQASLRAEGFRVDQADDGGHAHVDVPPVEVAVFLWVAEQTRAIEHALIGVGDRVVHNLRCDLGMRGDLPAPAEPDAGPLLKRRVDGDFKSAGTLL